MNHYNHKEIEEKWQKIWEESGLDKAAGEPGREKKYILDMFPYPSAAGLHVGHVESYTATDIYSRYLRMRGFDVLHPQGWDAFGLPAENYAIKTKIHPAETTKRSIEVFTRQIKSLGFSYDWSREINTSDPEYYKWTQWLFLEMYKNGLAYKKKAKVNWCESCRTVLANEQAEGGICERCKNRVTQKDLEQWFFKITDFIEDQALASDSSPALAGERRLVKGLLSGLDDVDWPESTKAAQRNWIGRSEGAEIEFRIQNSEFRIKVYTTRIDTIFGCTYCVVAPENEILEKIKNQIENKDEVLEYIDLAKSKTELERTGTDKEKTGVELKGIKAVNPFTGEEVPMFAADYVLGGYGTGAVMAVPAHDSRDFEFARKYGLPIKQVIKTRGSMDAYWDKKAQNHKGKEFNEGWNDLYANDGKLINSDIYNSLTSAEAREMMAAWLLEKGLGRKKVNYKLRDWLISRQRYWGAPIPIIYCGQCGEVPVPAEDLPVRLPTDVDFLPTGESPLARSATFHDVKCPRCGAAARREADTMDTFVCSSWYYLRYADPKNNKEFASQKALRQWLPVDTYVGGAEHTVLHLLYARFFTKVLEKFGYLDFNEPFLKLRHQGIILGEDGTKMSKSVGNVVNPDDVVAAYGADALRMYEMFMGPLEDMKPWNTKGIIGIVRFLERIWKIYEDFIKDFSLFRGAANRDSNKMLNKTIKKVTEDIENFRFNTAIASMMEYSNFIAGRKNKDEMGVLSIESAFDFLKLLYPFAPHIASELFFKVQEADEGRSGHNDIGREEWPSYDPELIKDETINLVLQVNGKVRDIMEVEAGISEEEARGLALGNKNIKKWLESKEILKVICVKDKLVNVVVK